MANQTGIGSGVHDAPHPAWLSPGSENDEADAADDVA